VPEAPLHHGPTRGGLEEGHKFDHWYRNTLDSYLRFFGHEPPTDIWPDFPIHFGQDLHFRRINATQHRGIPRPRLTGAPSKIVCSVLLILVLARSVLLLGPHLQNSVHLSNETPSSGIDSPPINEGDGAGALLRGDGLPWIIVIIVAGVLIAILQYALGNRCPKCKQ